MLIVPTSAIRQRIIEETRLSSPQFPQIIRSHSVMIPTLEWLQVHWSPWWLKYRASRRLKNYLNSFCDLIAGVAAAEMNWCAAKECERIGKDATAGIFETRLHINEPLLGIETGPHCTTLIAYTEDDSNFSLRLWEPQTMQYETIEAALTRADFMDVLL